MKKLFAVLAFAAFIVSCNDSTKTTSTTVNEDSLRLVREADSMKNAMQSAVDTSKTMINNAADSANMKMNQMADSTRM